MARTTITYGACSCLMQANRNTSLVDMVISSQESVPAKNAGTSRLIEHRGSFDSVVKGADEISHSCTHLSSAESANRLTVMRHRKRLSSVSRQPCEGRTKDGVSARQMSLCNIHIMLIDSETRDRLPLVLEHAHSETKEVVPTLPSVFSE